MSQIINRSTEDYICWFNFDKFHDRKIRNSSNMRIFAQNLLDIKRICEKYNRTLFLMYGTLLGAVRDKSFIKHDTDIDIGFFTDQKRGFYKILQELTAMDFELIRTSNNDNLITLLRDDEYTDMLFFSRNNLPFTNLIEYPFLNNIFLIPENYSEMLTDLYGDWQVPEKGVHATNLYGIQ